jgi:hypothetical protein
VRPLFDPLGPAAGRSGEGCALGGCPRLQPSTGGGAAVTHPLLRASPPSLSQTYTLPCHPAPDSDSGSGCSLQPLRPPLPPIRWRLRWLSLRCPSPGAPGPDLAGLPSPSAGVMRANRALPVLGFLLSLARGSEVGNSQAGKRRGRSGGLGPGSRT